ncbi:MAG: alkylation response protein AidB-like acyl-CoA dehydrogenase [Paraglaciecola psychrophila]|jgi:alkylation response protein AidB-like acyl-CoA dehydrogenase
MSDALPSIEAFSKEVHQWVSENKPARPPFLMPQSFMEVGTEEQFQYLKAWQMKVYEAGYLGMSWPKEYGGHSMPQVYQDIVTRELVAQDTPFMVNTLGLNWAGPLILFMGSEAQKKAYIQKILSTEEIWCQGFSEPDHGSDLGNAQLKAVRDGDEFVLNGSKIWTTLGTQASRMILLARTQSHSDNKYKGLTFFLAPMNVEGIEPRPIQKLTNEYGFCQTFFNDARIPADCIIGEEGEGWLVAMKTLMFERGAEGGQAGGHTAMKTVVEEVVDVAKRSYRDGELSTKDPLVRDELVKLIMYSQSMRLNAVRDGIPGLVSERPSSIAMASKMLVTEFNKKMGEVGTSVQGSNSLYFVDDDNAVDGGRWQQAYFQGFSGTIGGGTTQIQKNIIGERVLGLPKA